MNLHSWLQPGRSHDRKIMEGVWLAVMLNPMNLPVFAKATPGKHSGLRGGRSHDRKIMGALAQAWRNCLGLVPDQRLKALEKAKGVA
jgi:hypothetical protein